MDSLDEMACLTPLIEALLPLHRNIRRCGGPFDEQITLNVRISRWPDQHRFCLREFGNRLLGMNLHWIGPAPGLDHTEYRLVPARPRT